MAIVTLTIILVFIALATQLREKFVPGTILFMHVAAHSVKRHYPHPHPHPPTPSPAPCNSLIQYVEYIYGDELQMQHPDQNMCYQQTTCSEFCVKDDRGINKIIE